MFDWLRSTKTSVSLTAWPGTPFPKNVPGQWVIITEPQRVAIIDGVLIKSRNYSHRLGSFPSSWGGVYIGKEPFLLESPAGEQLVTLARIA